MRTTSVRFEHRPSGEPALGLGLSAPRLSWFNEEAPPGFDQRAVEVEVVRHPWLGETSTEVLRLEGPDQVLVPWPLPALSSRESASVRVRACGDDGTWGDWSDAAVVEAGLLTPAEWQGAHFISPVGIGGPDDPAPAVGTAFELRSPVRRARLHITAHGWYEPHINGERVGDDWFSPGWTAYSKRLRYYTYDVTSLLSVGQNRLDVLLGNGWYRGELTWSYERHYGGDLAVLARLEVVTEDGGEFVISTDDEWVARETHISFNSLYDGETQDLRRPLLAEAVSPTQILEESLDRLVAAEGPPVRSTAILPALEVWRSPTGTHLVDFGQNAVGFTRIKVRGLQEGTVITVRHAEVLEGQELGTRPLRRAKATDVYTMGSQEEYQLQPHFTFHGYRYVEVEGLAELLPKDICSVVLHSDMERTGWFHSSDPTLNRFHENVVWGMRGNFVDIPTDCPQRDERLGWTGDIQVFSESALFLYDCTGFLKSWCADMEAEQLPDGTVPVVVPNVLHSTAPQSPVAAWGDASVLVPWNLYLATGDTDILRAQLKSMRGWVDCIARLAGPKYLWEGGLQYGDWLDPDAPPEAPEKAKADPDVVATAHLFRSADVLSRACAVLDEAEASETYSILAEAVRGAYRNNYVSPEGLIRSDCQTVYAQAVAWGLLDGQERKAAGDRLVELVEQAEYRISTGFVGTPLVCEALSMVGHADTARRLLTERQCPSWLYPVTMGATTVWERWDSMLPDGSINPGGMTSFNHYALGAVVSWMHRRLAGLHFDPVERRVTVAPEPGSPLESASARLLTPYGPAESRWRLEDEALVVDVTVPAGTTGVVRLPDGKSHVVSSGHHNYIVAGQTENSQYQPPC